MAAYGCPPTKGFRERNCDFNGKPDTQKSYVRFEEQVPETTREPGISKDEKEAFPAQK